MTSIIFFQVVKKSARPKSVELVGPMHITALGKHYCSNKQLLHTRAEGCARLRWAVAQGKKINPHLPCTKL